MLCTWGKRGSHKPPDYYSTFCFSMLSLHKCTIFVSHKDNSPKMKVGLLCGPRGHTGPERDPKSGSWPRLTGQALMGHPICCFPRCQPLAFWKTSWDPLLRAVKSSHNIKVTQHCSCNPKLSNGITLSSLWIWDASSSCSPVDVLLCRKDCIIYVHFNHSQSCEYFNYACIITDTWVWGLCIFVL